MIIILCLSSIALGYGVANIYPRIEYADRVEYITLPPIEITKTITLPPEIKTEYVLEPYEVIKEVEVEKIVYIDRIVEVVPPNETQTIPWTSLLDIISYLKSTGIPDKKYIPTVYDCDDFALDLFNQAWKDRRFIGILDKHRINDLGDDYHHLMNCTIWKGLIYQVEPMTGNIAPIQTVD